MNNYQKTLKVLSIILIVCAALSIVIGIAFIAMAAANTSINSEVLTETGNMVITYGTGSTLLGLVFLVSGIIELIVGFFGLRGSKDPQKIGAFYVMALIGLIYEIASFVLCCVFYATNSVDTSTLLAQAISVIYVGICFWLSVKIKKAQA